MDSQPVAPELRKEEKWWWQKPGLRRLYFLLFIAVLSSATNGYDGSMMNGLQSLTFWQNFFGHPRGQTQGILNAIQSVGGVCALPIAPNLADYLGRHKTIFVGSLVVALGAGLQSGARDIGMFIAGRFFIGLGSGINGIASPLLITELAHPNQRGKITACYNVFYYFGSTIAAWTTFGTLRIASNWSWRLPSLLQVAPSAVQLVLVWLLPESPRWLIARDRQDEAHKILAKYHADGDMDNEAVNFEFAEIRASILEDKKNSRGRVRDILSTPGNRKRLFICVCCGLFSQLSGTGLTGYYLSTILDQAGITDPFFQTKLNGIIAITNWAEAIFWALMVDRIGRRRLFLTSNSGMVVTFSIWTAFTAVQTRTGSVSLGKGIIAIIFFHNFFYNLCWVSLNVAYPVEILPYNLRAIGLTVEGFTTSLALFFGQYVNPTGIQRAGFKFYLFYDIWLVIELIVIYFFFIETKGATLEEIAKTFDGDSAVEEVKIRALQAHKEEQAAQFEEVNAEEPQTKKEN